jgi:hypothetical protein
MLSCYWDCNAINAKDRLFMCIFLSDRECHKSGHDWRAICYHVPYIWELILMYPEVGIGTEYVLAKYFDIERFVI